MIKKCKYYICAVTLSILLGAITVSTSVAEVDIYGWKYMNGARDYFSSYPNWLFQKPKHYEFTSNKSNWEIQGEFPQSWQNEEWDSSLWPKGWKPDTTMLRLFRGDVFKKHYLKDGQIPVLVVGMQFYRLSSMDRERVVKFFADESDILNKGFDIIELVDWGDNRIIGSYSKYGMFLY